MRLVLASNSKARRRLMDGLGIPYEAISPDIEEVIPSGFSTADAVRRLARQKADAIAKRYPAAWVLAADQLAECQGRTLRQPISRDDAREQLKLVLGRTHQIITAVSLLGPGINEEVTEISTLWFYDLECEELERYLDLDEWRGCAGGYRIESAGQALLERLEGDRTNVEGLPMIQVVRLLRAAGMRFFGDPTPTTTSHATR